MPRFDARCAECSRWVGWSGGVQDQPRCPACGHQPDKASLETDAAQVEAFRQMLRTIALKKAERAGSAFVHPCG
jgi:hypothetical protein